MIYGGAGERVCSPPHLPLTMAWESFVDLSPVWGWSKTGV